MPVDIFMDMPIGTKMPAIGLGTGQCREESLIERSLNTAFELGYRHFDTAWAYENEVFVGRMLKKWFASGKVRREDLFITTKLPIAGINKDRVELFMKKSLENLQLDYVDLYLVHFPVGIKYVEGKSGFYEEAEFDEVDHIGLWKKMEEQVDTGRASSIGLSNFNRRQIENILKVARIKPSCLQIELHVDFQQRDLVNFCHENGIVVVAYSPLGKAAGPTREARRVPIIIQNETITKMASKYKKTNAQVMLRFLLQRNIVAIPGSSNPIRIKENINVFDFTIDDKDMQLLDNLDAGENARLSFWKQSDIVQHPEYPFGK